MADIFVSGAKRAQLKILMDEVGVRDDDLEEKFILGSGSGGQKVNKTASCVYLRHAASGLEVKCQQSRSRELNRYYARRLLCEHLDQQIKGAASRRQQAAEKIRRQKRRRSRRQREHMLEDKHKRADCKRLRAKIPVKDHA